MGFNVQENSLNLDKLKEYVLDDKKIISFKYLSHDLGISYDYAKRLLYQLVKEEGSKNEKLEARYYVSGLRKTITTNTDTTNGSSSETHTGNNGIHNNLVGEAKELIVAICNENELKNWKETLDEIYSIHVYCAGINIPQDSQLLKDLILQSYNELDNRTNNEIPENIRPKNAIVINIPNDFSTATASKNVQIQLQPIISLKDKKEKVEPSPKIIKENSQGLEKESTKSTGESSSSSTIASNKSLNSSKTSKKPSNSKPGTSQKNKLDFTKHSGTSRQLKTNDDDEKANPTTSSSTQNKEKKFSTQKAKSTAKINEIKVFTSSSSEENDIDSKVDSDEEKYATKRKKSSIKKRSSSSPEVEGRKRPIKKMRRVQKISDSSSEDETERKNSPSPSPNKKGKLKSKIRSVSSSESDQEEQETKILSNKKESNKLNSKIESKDVSKKEEMTKESDGKKRVAKIVSSQYMDEDGFCVTRQTKVFVTDDEAEPENENLSAKDETSTKDKNSEKIKKESPSTSSKSKDPKLKAKSEENETDNDKDAKKEKGKKSIKEKDSGQRSIMSFFQKK